MKLVLVRHAQTSANIDMVWHGHTDTPLTEVGHEQSRALGQHFNRIMEPDVIYASPLQRAKLTAEAIAENFVMPVHVDERLMEFGIGDWEDIGFDRLKNELNFIPKMLDDEHYSAPGGESRFGVIQRMTSAIEGIAEKHRGEKVVIVSHGMAMSLALGHWFGNEKTDWTNFVCDNTAVTEIKLNPHELLSFNNRDHLDDDLRSRSGSLPKNVTAGGSRPSSMSSSRTRRVG